MPESLDLARLRQRPQPRVPARAARTRRGRRLLGLARADARRGRAADAGDACASGYAATYAEMRARRLHGGRRVPLPRPRRGAARPRRPPPRPDRARAAPRRLRPRRAPALPPGVARRVPRPGRGAARRGHPRRPRPPLRPRLPAPTGSRRSAATPTARACRSTSTPTSSRARSRSASPSTAAGRSSCSPHRLPRPARRRSSTRRTPTARELDLLAEPAHASALCPTTEANLGDGFAPVEALLERAGSRSASARTRTSASTRSRSCASSRGSRAARPAAATSCSAERAARVRRRRRGRVRSASTAGPTIDGRPRAPVAARRRRADELSRPRSSSAAAADVAQPRMNRRTQYAVRSRYASLGGAAVQAPRAVVRLVAPPAEERDRPRRLDLRALVPLVVARDRDEVGLRADGRAPHPVVGRAVAARPDPRVGRRAARVVARARPRARRGGRSRRACAQRRVMNAVEEQDVVRVDAVEAVRPPPGRPESCRRRGGHRPARRSARPSRRRGARTERRRRCP